MMDAKAIEKLESMTLEATRIIEGVRAEPGDVYFKREADGSLARVVGERLRSIRAYDVQAFCEALAAHADLGRDAVTNIYAGRGMVTAFLDEDRRERLTLELPHAETFRRLQDMAGSRGKRDQDEVIDLLRVDLAGCVAPESVAAFRKLTFKKRSDGENHLEHASKGVGLSIAHELVGGKDGIPETIKVASRVYDDVDYEPEIILFVSCLVDEAAFVLRPSPGAIEEAVRDADEFVIEEIESIIGKWEGVSINVLHAGAIS